MAATPFSTNMDDSGFSREDEEELGPTIPSSPSSSSSSSRPSHREGGGESTPMAATTPTKPPRVNLSKNVLALDEPELPTLEPAERDLSLSPTVPGGNATNVLPSGNAGLGFSDFPDFPAPSNAYNTPQQHQQHHQQEQQQQQHFSQHDHHHHLCHHSPVAFSVGGGGEGGVVAPEEEQSSASGGVAKMVVPQERSPQDMKNELAENRVTIRDLQYNLESRIMQNEVLQDQFQSASEEYLSIIDGKNAEIEMLKDKVEECKVQISNLEKTNEEQRVKYEAEIARLRKEMEDKEREIESAKEALKQSKLERDKEIAVFEKEKANLETEITRKELKISQMETREECLKRQLAEANQNTAVARQTIAEKDAAMAREEKDSVWEENESIKKELKRRESEVSVLTERLNSMSSVTSTASDNSQNT